MAMTSPLYCVNKQHDFTGLGENQRIMWHDKTWFLTLTPLLKNGYRAPGKLNVLELSVWPRRHVGGISSVNNEWAKIYSYVKLTMLRLFADRVVGCCQLHRRQFSSIGLHKFKTSYCCNVLYLQHGGEQLLSISSDVYSVGLWKHGLFPGTKARTKPLTIGCLEVSVNTIVMFLDAIWLWWCYEW